MARKRKQQDINSSKITLGGVRTFAVVSRNATDFCQASATVYRSTEHQAEINMGRGQLSPMHETLMALERIGINPKAYYDRFPAAPSRPLWGVPLYAWIGQQVGWGASDVELALETASDILMLSA